MRPTTSTLRVNGVEHEVPAELAGASLLEVLRDHLGLTSVKDGCSPQGQCGCCTVLVDGEPRVSCVTPARRVAGRSVETLESLDTADRWADAFVATGASQCGFCTPGIVMRLEGLHRRGADLADRGAVDRALAAHLCRCTGWQTITEAAATYGATVDGAPSPTERDLDAASRRATIEGRAAQRVGPDVALGRAPFADDLAPAGTPVALRRGDGTWAVAATTSAARAEVGKVQGRRTTLEPEPPIPVPDGDWSHVLRTGWVEPAYLETDASWCAPGGEPSDPLANGGAFGGKAASPLPATADRLATETGGAVRLRWSREDTVRLGPKRPPMTIAVDAAGHGVVHVARTPGIAEAIARVAPDWEVVEVDAAGPPTSTALRAAGWGEVAAVRAALAADGDGACEVTTPEGAWARVRWDGERLGVEVRAGEVLDAVVLRSYCIGAAHMAIGWVTSESIAVGPDGEVADLTIRSFGIVRPGEMVPVDVTIHDDPGEDPTPGGDAVFVATAAAVWHTQGRPDAWPTRRPLARAGSA